MEEERLLGLWLVIYSQGWAIPFGLIGNILLHGRLFDGVFYVTVALSPILALIGGYSIVKFFKILRELDRMESQKKVNKKDKGE